MVVVGLTGLLQGNSSGIQYERRRLIDAVGEADPSEVMPNTRVWLQFGLEKVSSSITPSATACPIS